MTLDQYLTKHSVTVAEFAEAVGIDRSHVWRLRRGECRPQSKNMLRIEEVTKGKVRPKDWPLVPIKPAKAREPA